MLRNQSGNPPRLVTRLGGLSGVVATLRDAPRVAAAGEEQRGTRGALSTSPRNERPAGSTGKIRGHLPNETCLRTQSELSSVDGQRRDGHALSLPLEEG